MNLRPMLMSDADFLLELKNYEETRLYSIVSKEEIKRENHLKYLKENLEYFQVAEDTVRNLSARDIKTVRTGVIRIKNNEVSIWIDKKYWNLGIATQILKQVATGGMKAKIVETNVASMKAFFNAGFKSIEKIDNYYIFQK